MNPKEDVLEGFQIQFDSTCAKELTFEAQSNKGLSWIAAMNENTLVIVVVVVSILSNIHLVLDDILSDATKRPILSIHLPLMNIKSYKEYLIKNTSVTITFYTTNTLDSLVCLM